MKGAQLLGLWGPWWRQLCRNTACLRCRSYALSRSFLQPLVGDQKASLASLLCSAARSGAQRAPLPGVLLRCSVRQAHRGAPWLRSYTIDWHISH